MNFIDILLLIIIITAIVGGYRRGFILGGFDLVRWIGSILIAFWLYQYLALWLSKLFDGGDVWIPAISFLITLVAAGSFLRYLESRALTRIPAPAHRSSINRLLGIFPGIVNGAIIAAIVAAILMALPFPEPVNSATRESDIANTLTLYTDQVEESLAPVFDEAIARTLNRLTVKPETSGSVDLPFTVQRSRPRPELEAEMLRLVNEERKKEGLRPLAADTSLRGVARRHSTDMLMRGYFSHVTPEGDTPFDRIRRSRIRFRTAGENLALAPTVRIAHRGLMNSPGHRANILRPSFGRVGIGIMDGGVHGIMVTQNFRN